MAILAIALALAVPATVSAGTFSASKIGEQVVEGHTVFTVLQKKVVEQGFDIVIKVREVRRGPNVLWFNDQWKVFQEEVRQPCGGYVIATWTGVDPMMLLGRSTIAVNGITQPIFHDDPAGAGSIYDNTGIRITYVESYQITDPNGAVWITDLYAMTGTVGRVIPFWVSSVHNAQVDDDGVSHCDGILDLATHKDPGSNGVPYNDNVDSIPVREYNADIFGLWGDVRTEAGVKQHGEGGLNNGDGTGCEYGTEWECASPDNAAADDFEGNSHPYNPNELDAGPIHTHETGRLDVWFFSTLGIFGATGGYPPNPRNFEVFDTEVVESEVKACDPSDPFNNILAGFHDHC